MKIIAVSGYFDPFHVGHLENFELAKELGDKLVVIVNNDTQAILKKGGSFMSQEDRLRLISALEIVDDVFLSIDDDKSVCKSLAAVKPHIFAKGGDRHSGEIPESVICKEHGIRIVDGLGDKIRASSKIVRKIKESNEK